MASIKGNLISAAIGERHFAELAAILFSIARTAATGKDRVYITRYNGPGSLVAMLNAKLSSQLFIPYAALPETMLRHGAVSDRLSRDSLAQALRQAMTEADQIAPGHPVWMGTARLFPEIFDGLRRAELADLGKLPNWASGEAEAGTQGDDGVSA